MSGKERHQNNNSLRKKTATPIHVAIFGLIVIVVAGAALHWNVSTARESLLLASSLHERLRTSEAIASTWVDSQNEGEPMSLPEPRVVVTLLDQCTTAVAGIAEQGGCDEEFGASVVTELRTIRNNFSPFNRETAPATYRSSIVGLHASLRAIAGGARRLVATKSDALANAESAGAALLGLLVAGEVAILLILGHQGRKTVTRPVVELTEAIRKSVKAGSGFLPVDNGPSEVQQLSQAVSSFAEQCNATANHRSTQLTTANDKLRLLNVTIQKEMHRRESIEEQLRHDAGHDALTQLPNRHLMLDRIEYLIERSKRDPHYRFAVLFLDLDDFKHVNDTLGHRAGDALLVEVAQRLSSCLRSLDTVERRVVPTTARLGGDEFVILLDDIRHTEDAVHVAERIQQELGKPMSVESHPTTIGASIGIAVSDGRSFDCEELLRDADIAMYRAKQAGKFQHAVFDTKMHDAQRRRFALEAKLRRALEHEQFELFYQPIIDLKRNVLHGFEALIRWRDADEGIIMPGDFIPLAEETGLIVPIGEWVLSEACRQLDQWQPMVPMGQRISMSINVARRQLIVPGFLTKVDETIKRSGLSPDQINLEVTEGTALEVVDHLPRILDEIKELGVNVHMDDFGTGHSSLSCLHSFPVDVLKIDRSFVTDAGTNRGNTGILASIMAMASSLNMRVVAEGIECRKSLATLRSLNCDFGQGYYFSEPVRAADALEMIQFGGVWSNCAEFAGPLIVQETA